MTGLAIVAVVAASDMDLNPRSPISRRVLDSLLGRTRFCRKPPSRRSRRTEGASIWLGTDEGLNRFDGYRFVTYVNDLNVSTTLAHNWVWALYADAHGAVWVGTDGGGLDRLDPITGVFEHRALVEHTDARIVVRAIVAEPSGAL